MKRHSIFLLQVCVYTPFIPQLLVAVVNERKTIYTPLIPQIMGYLWMIWAAMFIVGIWFWSKGTKGERTKSAVINSVIFFILFWRLKSMGKILGAPFFSLLQTGISAFTLMFLKECFLGEKMIKESTNILMAILFVPLSYLLFLPRFYVRSQNAGILIENISTKPLLICQSRFVWLFGAIVVAGVIAFFSIEKVHWRVGIISVHSFFILFAFRFIFTVENSLIRYFTIGAMLEFEIILKGVLIGLIIVEGSRYTRK